jgi:hypothetical protein
MVTMLLDKSQCCRQGHPCCWPSQDVAGKVTMLLAKSQCCWQCYNGPGKVIMLLTRSKCCWQGHNVAGQVTVVLPISIHKPTLSLCTPPPLPPRVYISSPPSSLYPTWTPRSLSLAPPLYNFSGRVASYLDVFAQAFSQQITGSPPLS